MDTTSPTLLRRLQDTADASAWDRFAELYTPVLYRWARGLGLQESDAADLVQDVFATLVKQMPVFVYDNTRSFRAWLKTVAVNRWRTLCRRPPAGGGGVDPDELAAQPAEAFWEAEYRKHLVARALDVMKAEFQESSWRACWLMIVEGKSAAEAGAEVGLGAGAVRAAKFRVLARLRQELDGLLD